MDFKKIMNKVGEKSPTIFAVLGVVGLGTTTLLAIKATPKAIDKLNEAYENIDEDKSLSLKEELKIVAPIYASTVVCGVATAACIIGSNHINQKRNVSLVAAYKVSEETIKTMREKIADSFGGEDVVTAMDMDIMEDKVSEFIKREEESPLKRKTTSGKSIDLTSGRRFNKSRSELETIELQLNSLLRRRDFVSLNEYYSMVGLERTELGRTIGWFGVNHSKWNGDVKMNIMEIMHSDGASVSFSRNEPVSRYA